MNSYSVGALTESQSTFIGILIIVVSALCFLVLGLWKR